MSRLRFLTAGESHGPELIAILEGMPAGLRIDRGALDILMARRQVGYGSGGRMSIERDAARIVGGVQGGLTTGAPIALRIENRDHANWAERDIPPMTIPRPGHADLSAAVKFGYRDLRVGLERASARETAARVAVGGICLQLLGSLGVRVGSYVVRIGDAVAALSPSPSADEYARRFEAAEAEDIRCPDPEAAERMRQAIRYAIRAKDTLGGIFEVVALGVPPGLGSHVHWDRRLSGRLLGAVGSIQAVKGVEIGPAFENASMRGTEVHDRFRLEADGDGREDAARSRLGDSGEIESRNRRIGGGDGDVEGGISHVGSGDGDVESRISRIGGRGGGLEGGITTGAPLVVRGAMKPISTTLTPLESIDLATGSSAETAYERSDFCAVPRAAVVAEAMVAFVIADALLEKLGGDSMDELLPRHSALRRNRPSELPMDNVPWRFDYSGEADADATDADADADANANAVANADVGGPGDEGR